MSLKEFNWKFHFLCTVNWGTGGDKNQNILWKSKNIPPPQLLKYVVINCGRNGLDTDNADKISGEPICIVMFLKKKNIPSSNCSRWTYSRWCSKQRKETWTVHSKSIATRHAQTTPVSKTRWILDYPKWSGQQRLLLQRLTSISLKTETKSGTINYNKTKQHRGKLSRDQNQWEISTILKNI